MQTRSATRASSGLPRKRPSYDLDDLRPSRARARQVVKNKCPSYDLNDLRPSRAKARQVMKKPFPLMSLPAEIRLKILRELLWDPEPLGRLTWSGKEPACPSCWSCNFTDNDGYDIMAQRSSFYFHPAILAVCRQLNEEGSPILYEENVLDVKLAAHDVVYPHVHWMGPDSASTGLNDISAEVLFARARKLKITVQVTHPGGASPFAMRRAARELVMTLQENPQWSSLEILLERYSTGHLATQVKDVSRLDEDILRPFNTLRRLQYVNFTGVSERFAHHMSALMKSDEPVLDLPRMYRNMKSWATNQGIAYHHLVDELSNAQTAMDDGNVDAFYRLRDQVMWKVMTFLERGHTKVFEHDPDPLSARLAWESFIEDKENLTRTEEA